MKGPPRHGRKRRKTGGDRIPRAQVMALAGLTTTAGLTHRIKIGAMPPAGEDRCFDKAEVLAAIARFAPRTPGRKPTARAKPGREASFGGGDDAGEQKANLDEFAGLDPETLFRTAKAQQEVLKLRKMRAELMDAGLVERRCAAFFTLVKGRVEGFVAKTAPGIAARVTVSEGRVVEGSLYREMQEEVRKLLDDLSKMDLKAALARSEEEDDEDADIKAFNEAAAEEKPAEKKGKKLKP